MSFREKFKNRRASLLTSMDHSRQAGVLFFLISLLAHGLFFGSLIAFQDFKRPKPLPPVIQIDLVSFAPEPAIEEPARKEAPAETKGIPVKTPVVKQKPKKTPTIKPDISLKTKPKNLKELMAQQKKKNKVSDKKKDKKPVKKKPVKKVVDPEKTLGDAREELEKKVEDQNQNRMAEVLSRLQKKVAEQGKTKQGQAKESSAGYGKKGYKPIDLYKMVLGQSIEQNWVFNDILAGMNQTLEVRILIKILKSGEIRDIIYETRSGNRYLDESAKKAIKKTNPLPALPSGMHSYDVVVIFTPQGLK